MTKKEQENRTVTTVWQVQKLHHFTLMQPCKMRRDNTYAQSPFIFASADSQSGHEWRTNTIDDQTACQPITQSLCCETVSIDTGGSSTLRGAQLHPNGRLHKVLLFGKLGHNLHFLFTPFNKKRQVLSFMLWASGCPWQLTCENAACRKTTRSKIGRGFIYFYK